MTTLRSASNTRGVFKTLAFASLLASAIGSVSAATITWGGGTGDYLTAGNWTGGSVPNTNGGDTAVINGGAVTYTPGGDLTIHSGGTLQINGGSWTQAGGNAWIQAAGGTILVTGGVFNQGTADNIIRDANSVITISGGTANLNGNLLYLASNGAFNLSGSGVANIAGEFKPIDTFTMTGGTLSANLISFADGPGSINISGGQIRLNGAGANSGFYGGGTQSLNFSNGSAGSVFFSTYTIAELGTDGFLTNGTIRYNGLIDSSKFNVSEVGGGVLVSAITAVPEPSTYAALAGSIILGVALLRRRKQA